MCECAEVLEPCCAAQLPGLGEVVVLVPRWQAMAVPPLLLPRMLVAPRLQRGDGSIRAGMPRWWAGEEHAEEHAELTAAPVAKWTLAGVERMGQRKPELS